MALIQQRWVELLEPVAAGGQWGAVLLAAALLAALLAALSGVPEGQVFAGVRLVFWFMHTLGGLLLMGLLSALMQRLLPGHVPAWGQLGLGAVLGAALFTPAALCLEYAFAAWGVGQADASTLRMVLSIDVIAQEFVALAVPFVVCWLLLNWSYQSVRAATAPDADSSREPEPTRENPAAAGLLAELPPALGPDIWWLKADLNYVHVTTALGNTMLLYSLARATDELGNAGLRVHRSHWVSVSAIARVQRSGGKTHIELKNGAQVPVSRRREPQVRALFGTDFRRATEPTQTAS